MKPVEMKHHLLTEHAICQLKLSKITSVKLFLDANDNELSKITKLNTKEIGIVKNYFVTMYGNYLPVSQTEYQDHLRYNFNETSLLQTGIPVFDDKLYGITMGSIIELSGDSTAGKTIFCTTLAINFLEKHNLECYWIDTKMDLSPIYAERVMRPKFDGKALIDAMKKFHLSRVFTINEVIDELEYLLEEVDTGFLVLDSLTSVLSECLGKRYKEGEEGFQKIVQYIRILCTRKKFIAVITVLPRNEKKKNSVSNNGQNDSPQTPSPVESNFKDFSSEQLFIRRTETDLLKLQNTSLLNSNERFVFLTKSLTNLTNTRFCVKLTDQGVV